MARTFRAKIAAIAEGEQGQTPCSRKTGKKKGYFSSCHSLANPSLPELWCADFVRWVWWKAGAINTAPGTNTLTPGAISFLDYGPLRKKPRVGDAVLFDREDNPPRMGHVAVVTEVRADGTIVSVGGDEGGRSGTDAHFAATARVIRDGPYNAKPGTSDSGAPNSPLVGYVSPVEDDMPFTDNEIRNLVKQGVRAELKKGPQTQKEIKALVKDAVTQELNASGGVNEKLDKLIQALVKGG